ncbi:flagellin-like protein [Halorubrum coriense DSM 10284]|uniref:Flagellin-like protein n=2 Tax=Halorubrum coriense TaxID=64713 RepID=M0EUJ9_9EURY|nr:flagellin-like protein [Halorubrum coriense DSM 10284]
MAAGFKQMKPSNQSNADDRAVSPVIGVILMVAITVILAAVIGTFVLGLGDQLGDTAPQASFSADNAELNSSNVDFDITKTGGQDLDPTEIVLVVDGTRVGTVNANATSVGDPWRTGTTAVFENIDNGQSYSDGQDVDVRLVHDPSGNSVYETTITVRSP